MKNRQFTNEKGLTLVELLAALSLFAVVITLSSTIIIQLINSQDKTADKITSSQDANVVINDLRNQYYQENSSICLDESNLNFSIEEVSNGNIIDGCVEDIDVKQPLSIKVVAANDLNNDISIETTWVNNDEYILDTEENDEFTDFIPLESIETNCRRNSDDIFEQNIKFTDKVTIENKNSTNCNYTFLKSVVFSEGVTIENQGYLEIMGDVYLPKGLTIERAQRTICVHGEIFPKDNNLTIKETNSCRNIHQNEGVDILKII